MYQFFFVFEKINKILDLRFSGLLPSVGWFVTGDLRQRVTNLKGSRCQGIFLGILVFQCGTDTLPDTWLIHQPTLRDNPEELISQLHSNESLRLYWTNVKQTEFNFGADSQYHL